MSYRLEQETESAIKNAAVKILKEYLGEEAKSINIQVVDNIIIIRFKGILSQAEKHFARDKRNTDLMKELKNKLIEKIKPVLKTIIEGVTRMNVIDIHSDVDIKAEERIEIITLGRSLDE